MCILDEDLATGIVNCKTELHNMDVIEEMLTLLCSSKFKLLV